MRFFTSQSRYANLRDVLFIRFFVYWDSVFRSRCVIQVHIWEPLRRALFFFSREGLAMQMMLLSGVIEGCFFFYVMCVFFLIAAIQLWMGAWEFFFTPRSGSGLRVLVFCLTLFYAKHRLTPHPGEGRANFGKLFKIRWSFSLCRNRFNARRGERARKRRYIVVGYFFASV